MKQQVYMQTYGCQMNERDSEEVLGMLTSQGYEVTQVPDKADLILLNTCSVRENAEDRAYGRMSELSEIKRANPNLVMGMIGCMAKLHQEKIFKQQPYVDLVAGPAELYDLPYLLAELEQKRRKVTKKQKARVMAVGRQFRPVEERPKKHVRTDGVRAFVSIIEGCDKACSYCIVPKTRGQEISRTVEDIVSEVNQLVAEGYKEVTLLGQNVNSYGKRFPDGTGFKGPLGRMQLLENDPESLVDFAQLLRVLQKRTNMPRIRFTTSHPFDANERLFKAIADCPAVCESLHLPVQSGSNTMLRAMKRGYTHEAYLKKIELLRQWVPDVALSTDIIIGYPGETEADFQRTVDLMEAVRYDNAYIFKYSPRPGTDSALKEDDVPTEVKAKRNQLLLALHDRIILEKLQAMVGSEQDVLIEGPARKPNQLFARTRGSFGVILEESDPALIGQFARVKITRTAQHSLFGTRIVDA